VFPVSGHMSRRWRALASPSTSCTSPPSGRTGGGEREKAGRELSIAADCMAGAGYRELLDGRRGEEANASRP
jgi:hypothetical protein